MKKYQIICADPPWNYNNKQFNKVQESGSASKHYKVMDVQEMIDEFTSFIYDISDKDCLLFMWATWPFLAQAIYLGESWGFKYVQTPFIWNKEIHNPGYYTLTETECVLCFKKGKISTPRGSRKERQIVNSKRTQHSVKPQEVYDRISRMFPTQNKIEMFSRNNREGWDYHGNEIL